jgi:hypothetical protein
MASIKIQCVIISENKERRDSTRKEIVANIEDIHTIIYNSPKEALEKLVSQSSAHFFIIDLGMSQMTPMDTVHQIFELCGERPVFFIGENSLELSRIDTDALLKMKIHFFVLKWPLIIDKLVEDIEKIHKLITAQIYEDRIEIHSKDSLLPMRVKFFYMFKKMPYDVYVRLTQEKHIIIIKKDEEYTQAFIYSYVRRKVKFLYVGKDNFLKALEKGINNLTQIFRDPDSSLKKLLGAQLLAYQLIHQYVMALGVSPVIEKFIPELLDSFETCFDKVETDEDILTHLPYDEGDFAEQGVLTNYLCLVMLRGLQWVSKTSRMKLGLASILYDCNVEDIKLTQIFNIDDFSTRVSPDPEKLEKFRKHPEFAANLAGQVQGISDAQFIIKQHHELPYGGGFQRMPHHLIQAHSCIFILSTHFSGRLSCRRTDPRQVLYDLEDQFKIGNFIKPLNVLIQKVEAAKDQFKIGMRFDNALNHPDKS